MTGRLFAQIVALILIWGVVFFAATRLVDGRRNAYATSFLNASRAALSPVTVPGQITDDRLMGNAEVSLNAIDDPADNLSGE
jgi:hypothetical protein